MTKVGDICGRLSITLDGCDPVNIGRVTLPLVANSLSKYNFTFSVGVDFCEVKKTVEEIFRQAGESIDD